MARVCLIVVLCLMFVGEYANSNLIHGINEEPLFSIDIKAVEELPQEDIVETNHLTSEPEVEEIPEVTTFTKKCAQIGEFCMNSSDCCSNLCMGYMKRCVSNSG